MYGCCVLLALAHFVFQALVIFPAWVSRTRRLLKQVATFALSVPLRVPNAALVSILASLESEKPFVLSRFHLRKLRGLLVAINTKNALARETARSLWLVAALLALPLSD